MPRSSSTQHSAGRTGCGLKSVVEVPRCGPSCPSSDHQQWVTHLPIAFDRPSQASSPSDARKCTHKGWRTHPTQAKRPRLLSRAVSKELLRETFMLLPHDTVAT
ncbi:hypothetical protein NDU88_002407 [Pleurodeles waltl]|uniref:Uncharacterized protein n=1 Tax=Pleurodeles waltl TaxID=8319 RepID=A0AAV7SCE0_PLEWA|nr:hypothetical protein NDU88_002407 [Pleurodeles waltl]